MTKSELSPPDRDVIATDVNKLTIATGPVARYLDEPKIAAIDTGRREA